MNAIFPMSPGRPRELLTIGLGMALRDTLPVLCEYDLNTEGLSERIQAFETAFIQKVFGEPGEAVLPSCILPLDEIFAKADMAREILDNLAKGYPSDDPVVAILSLSSMTPSALHGADLRVAVNYVLAEKVGNVLADMIPPLEGPGPGQNDSDPEEQHLPH